MFSVVIATYNRASLLSKTLGSVFAQTFKNYEIIVVDDGSTDATQDCLKSLGNRITVLIQPNHGPGPRAISARDTPKGTISRFSTAMIYGFRGRWKL